MPDTNVIKSPGPVDLKTGNVHETWRRFKQKFDLFLIAADLSKVSTERKCAILLGEAGDHALEVYNSFVDKLKTTNPPADDGTVTVTDHTQNYEKVLEKFDEYAAEKKSLTSCRELFNQRHQKKTEPFINWLTDLKNLVKDCGFGSLEDSLLRDRLILGTRDRRLQEALRTKPNLSLEEVIEASKAAELTHKAGPSTSEPMEIDAISHSSSQAFQSVQNNRRGHPRGRRGSWRGKGRGSNQSSGRVNKPGSTPARPANQRGRNHQPNSKANQQNPRNNTTYLCSKCGSVHAAAQCPAHNKQCSKCKGLHHFAAVCRSRRPNQSALSQDVDSLESVLNTTESVVNSWV